MVRDGGLAGSTFASPPAALTMPFGASVLSHQGYAAANGGMAVPLPPPLPPGTVIPASRLLPPPMPRVMLDFPAAGGGGGGGVGAVSGAVGGVGGMMMPVVALPRHMPLRERPANG